MRIAVGESKPAVDGSLDSDDESFAFNVTVSSEMTETLIADLRQVLDDLGLSGQVFIESDP